MDETAPDDKQLMSRYVFPALYSRYSEERWAYSSLGHVPQMIWELVLRVTPSKYLVSYLALLIKNGAVLSAVNFSILAEMPSGPLDFETSIIAKIL